MPCRSSKEAFGDEGRNQVGDNIFSCTHDRATPTRTYIHNIVMKTCASRRRTIPFPFCNKPLELLNHVKELNVSRVVEREESHFVFFMPRVKLVAIKQ